MCLASAALARGWEATYTCYKADEGVLFILCQACCPCPLSHEQIWTRPAPVAPGTQRRQPMASPRPHSPPWPSHARPPLPRAHPHWRTLRRRPLPLPPRQQQLPRLRAARQAARRAAAALCRCCWASRLSLHAPCPPSRWLFLKQSLAPAQLPSARQAAPRSWLPSPQAAVGLAAGPWH